MKANNRKPVQSVKRANPDMVIKTIVRENPLKPGSFCFAQLEAARKSRTVAEAQKKLHVMKSNPTPKRRLETAWLQKQGFIKLVPGTSHKKAA